VLLVLLGSLGALFLWGVLAPRSQWRVLLSWTYRDPHTNEPTGVAYVLYRVVAMLGIVAMAISIVGVSRVQHEEQPDAYVPPTAVERMWGTKAPVVVNRVVTPETRVPKGYVDQPILGYQPVEGKRRQPPYLFSLPNLSLESATTRNGYVGVDPPTGLAALDNAQLVVEVAGDPLCFPHHVVIVETESAVRIAVYYGQADPQDGSNADAVADCEVKASAKAITTLIPIQLGNGLGERVVQSLSGDPIREVPVLE